ncbi:MAG: hypothetical protein HFG88_13055 [Dorea sp.]|nr:hypothetical protein [Dorea sp.]
MRGADHGRTVLCRKLSGEEAGGKGSGIDYDYDSVGGNRRDDPGRALCKILSAEACKEVEPDIRRNDTGHG